MEEVVGNDGLRGGASEIIKKKIFVILQQILISVQKSNLFGVPLSRSNKL